MKQRRLRKCHGRAAAQLDVEAVEKPYFDEGSISETIRAAKKENPGDKVETEHGTARPTSRALTEGYYAEPTSNVFYRQRLKCSDLRVFLQTRSADEPHEHVARHGVEPEEVEEVCFDDPLVLRAKSRGENRVYYVLGQTEDGRYLFCLVIEFPGGTGYPVTARQMTAKEERRFKQWKKK